MRHDKLATNDLAFILLASIRPWSRVNESTPWHDVPRVWHVLCCLLRVDGT